MSDMNHEYHIKGAPRVLTKVTREINNFRSEYRDPERSRYCNPVIKNIDGTLSWSGWEDMLMWDLDDDLAGLTHRNATKIWAYHGETNESYIRGYLLVMEKGRCREVGHWDADVGFESAMAAFKLEHSPSVDAAMVLLKDLERECKQSDRMSAVVADMLLSGLLRHPSLASNESIWTRVMAIKGPIEASDIKSEEASGDSGLDPNRVRWLLAKLEAKKIEDGLTTPVGEATSSKAVRL